MCAGISSTIDISGAGPTVLALCASSTQADSVYSAFVSTAHELRVAGESLQLALTDLGAHVVG